MNSAASYTPDGARRATTMSRQKGTRNERKTRKVYERAGYWTYSPANATYGDNDLWNLFDIAAFHPHHEEVRFVQVKTNGAAGISKWAHMARHFTRVPGIQCDFVVRHDSEGYRLMKPYHESYMTVFDSRDDDANMGDSLASFLRGEYDG